MGESTAFAAGSRLGAYQIIGCLGTGGMGEVYRAVDTRLGRHVALKVLPEGLADDPELHARFEREARVLASLNHSNIATLYGLEHADERHVLVMELVDGEGLEKRISRGPVPVEDAIPIALQVAEALAAAHERGIVHRDLKPANVMVRPDGTVKVLDFGLAKVLDEAPPDGNQLLSPTVASERTWAGTILGTAAYMSPEQARGRPVDARTDIWAFGAVVWEMLSGHALFAGDTAADVFAAVLTREPDWREGAQQFGEHLVTVLRGCLKKDLRQRFNSARDVGLLLTRAVRADATSSASVPPREIRRRVPAALAGVVAIAAMAIGASVVWSVRSLAPQPGAVRLSVVDPDIIASSGVAISPDGRRLAFVLGEDVGNVLAIRTLDDFDAVTVPGTQGAMCPFFSPDGQWVGYFTRTELRKVAVSGGSQRTIASLAGKVRFDPWSAAHYPTADWGEDDTIVFSSGFWREPSTLTGLFTVPGVGGEPAPLTSLDGTELAHLWPHFTPDGRHVVFTALNRGPRNRHVDIIDRGSGRRQRLQNDVENGQVVGSAFLISLDRFYSRLVAAPIDTARLELSGTVVPLIEGISTGPTQSYAVSRNGTLTYFAAGGGGGEDRLVRVGLDGAVTTVLDRRGSWYQPRASRDGRHLVVREVGEECRLWLLDLKRGTFTPLTNGGDNHQPIWTHSGREVAFGREDLSRGVRGLFRLPIDGSGEPEQLLGSGSDRRSRSLSVPYPDSFSPGDREVLFEQSTLETGSDLWLLSLESGVAAPYLATPAVEGDGAFSPDGRWVAYVSDESGRQEVYVRSYPGQGGRAQISVVGGEWPLWSPDGTRLYFSQSRRLMAVDFDGTGTAPIVGQPRAILRGFDFGRGNLDLLPDGSGFVLVQPVTPGTTELRVVTGWTQGLRDAVPERQRR